MDVKVSFDWFKFSTDKVLYNEFYHSENINEILKSGENDIVLNEVVNILNHHKMPYTCYDLNLHKCARGYTYGIALDEGISVSLLGPKTDSSRFSTLFELTGKGCYHFSKNVEYIKNWYEIFNIGLLSDFKFTRLDIAYDLIGDNDVDDFIKWLLEKIKNGYCRTRWKETYDSEVKSPNDGYTMYLGAPASASRIRIYNKNSEKVSKDKNCFIEENNYWRIEIQLTANSNNDLDINRFIKSYVSYFQNYVENDVVSQDISDFRIFLTNFLNKYIEVRLKDDERMSRCSIDPRWQKFIGELQKNINFEQSDKKRRTAIEIKRDWLERSAFKAMAQIYFCYGKRGFSKFIHSNLIAAMEDFKDIDRIQIINFFEENGQVCEFIENGKISLKNEIEDFKENLKVEIMRK